MSTQTTTEQAVVVAPKREIRPVHDESPVAYLMDTARFEHCYRIAQMMSRASLIPKHLKGDGPEQTAANCFLVVNQSLRWEMDPFAVAPETYEVGGKLGFQGKLVAAVVNARAGLSERLAYTFNDKKGDELEVTVTGKLRGETESRSVSVTVKEARTQNQMWTKDPYQKLCYTGATKWARRHCPEIMLGVYTDDDLERFKEESKFASATQIADAPPVFVSAPTPAAEKKKAKKGAEPVVVETETAPEPATEPAPEPAPAEQPAKSEFPSALYDAMDAAGVFGTQLLAFYNKNKGTDLKSLDEIPSASQEKLLAILAKGPDNAQVKQMKG